MKTAIIQIVIGLIVEIAERILIYETKATTSKPDTDRNVRLLNSLRRYKRRLREARRSGADPKDDS